MAVNEALGADAASVLAILLIVALDDFFGQKLSAGARLFVSVSFEVIALLQYVTYYSFLLRLRVLHM